MHVAYQMPEAGLSIAYALKYQLLMSNLRQSTQNEPVLIE